MKGRLRHLSLWMAIVASACDERPPSDPALARMLAETEAIRGQIDATPNSPLLHYRLGMAFAENGYVDSAIAAYERSVAIHRAFPQAYFELGDLYLTQNKISAAIRAYEAAVQSRPDWVDAHNNLGFVYKRGGQLDRAQKQYERALQLDSTFVHAYNNLGQVYKERGEWDVAISQFEKAISVQPMFQDAYLNLAMAYKKNGYPEAEAEVLKDLVDLFGTTDQQGAYARNRLAELRGSP